MSLANHSTDPVGATAGDLIDPHVHHVLEDLDGIFIGQIVAKPAAYMETSRFGRTDDVGLWPNDTSYPSHEFGLNATRKTKRFWVQNVQNAGKFGCHLELIVQIVLSLLIGMKLNTQVQLK